MDNKDTLNALKNGNIPSDSIMDFSVGREKELNEFKNLLMRVENGSAITRFINGEFGSGKSFFLKLLEETAYEQDFVVSKITLSQNLTFHKIVDIYKEITKTLKCKSGNSLNHIIERWITGLKIDADDEFEDDEDIKLKNKYVYDCLQADLKDTRDCHNAFATVIENYYIARQEGNITTANNAQAWLRGDSNIPAAEKRKFGVVGNIDKKDVFHYLNALSTFIKSIGYSGLVILIDEAEFVLKTPRQNSRDVSYNYMREIYDKCNDGTFRNMLYVFAGTQEFFEDEKRGVKSYDALYSRIVNVLESDYEDLRTPIIHLHGFKEEDMKKILKIVVDMHKSTYDWDTSIVESALDEFIEIHVENSGLTGGLIVPRNFLRELVSVLDTVEQNQDKLNNKEDIIKLFKQEEDSNEEGDIFDDWG